MTELLLLAAVAFLAGFCTGWSLRAALARADRLDLSRQWSADMFGQLRSMAEEEEIVPLTNAPGHVNRNHRKAMKFFEDRGSRS